MMKTDPDQDQPIIIIKKKEEEVVEEQKKNETKEEIRIPTTQPVKKEEQKEKKEEKKESKENKTGPRKSLRRPIGNTETTKTRQSVIFQLSEWKQANQLMEQATGKKEDVTEVKEDKKKDPKETKDDIKQDSEKKIKGDLLQLLDQDQNRMQALEKHTSNFRQGRVQASVYYYFLVKTFGASVLPRALPLVLLWLTSSPNRQEALRCMHGYAIANKCARCHQSVYHQEGLRAADRSWHRWCFKCCYDPASPLSPLSPTSPRSAPPTSSTTCPTPSSLTSLASICTATLTVNNYISYKGLIYCQKHAPK